MIQSPFRVGVGYDSHRLVPGRKLILGGVEIPFEMGLQGHSDADVVLHALTDAICGAANLPDIGRLFPDDDPQFKNAASGPLLQQAAKLAREKGFEIGNVDCVLVAQKPKISPFVPLMKKNVALLLQIPEECVNLRGKTAEEMDDVGAGKGMIAHAVALLLRSEIS